MNHSGINILKRISPVKILTISEYTRGGLGPFQGVVYKDTRRNRILTALIPFNILLRWCMWAGLYLKHPGAYGPVGYYRLRRQNKVLERKNIALSRAFSVHEPVLRTARELTKAPVEQWTKLVVRLKDEIEDGDVTVRRIYDEEQDERQRERR